MYSLWKKSIPSAVDADIENVKLIVSALFTAPK